MTRLRNSLLKLPKIPSLAEWNQQFKSKGSMHLPRATLADLKAAGKSLMTANDDRSRVAYALMIELALSKVKLPSNPSEMTAVELYPGFGAWTVAMANAGFQRIIALENNTKYAKWMGNIAKESQGVVELVKKDGYDWDTYMDLKKPEFLGNLVVEDWSKVHPNILFTGTLPKSSRGEQLLAQFTTCIHNRMAMHTNGRIQMLMWIPEILYTKFTAPPGSIARCKMGIVADACADIELVHVAKVDEMYPHTDYYLTNVIPFENKKVQAPWDVFEYVLKHLFVMQRQPLSKMIKTLGPGAEIISSRLSFDPSIEVGNMTVEQIDEVAIKFDQWPLRPRVLFEYDFD